MLTSATSALFASEAGLASRIGRTLNHAEMKKVSVMVAHGRLPKAVQPPVGSYQVPADLGLVADAFVALQQARHEADYEVSASFTRQEAISYIESARQAFEAWDRAKKTDDARMYLACFLLWKRWDEEPR
jgi:hypothetical protein